MVALQFRLVSKLLSHQQPFAEAGRLNTNGLETARGIESFSVGIANHMQSRRTACYRELRAAIKQAAADAMPPNAGLHKQPVQLCLSIGSGKNSRESNNFIVSLGDKHLT